MFKTLGSLLCFLILSLGSQKSLARDRQKDSLIALVKTTKPDTNKVNALIDLAEYDFSDSLMTFNSLKEAKELAERINFKKGILRTLIVYSNYYNQSGQMEKALGCCNEGLQIIRDNKLESLPLWFVKLKLTIGNTYIVMANYEKAIKEYLEAIPVAEEGNYVSILVSLLSNTSIAFRNMEQFDTGLKYALKALRYEGLMKDRSRLATLYQTVGNAYYDLAKTDSTLKYYNKELAIRRTLNDKYALADNYDNIGIYHGDLKQYDKALDYCMHALRIREEIKYVPGIAKSYQAVASIYQGQKKYREAIQMLDKSLIYAKQCNNALQQEDTYYYLGYNYALVGDYLHAYENNVRYAKIRDSILNSDMRQKVVEMEVKYKTDQIIRDKEQSEQTAHQEQRIYLISFICLILFLFGIFYFLNQRKNTSQKLAVQQQRLESIIEGEEKERTRIAKDLHDGIVQDLTAIKLKLQGRGEKNEFLNEVSAEIDRAAKEVRDISYQMMPVALKEYGLARSLEDLLQKMLNQKEIRFEFETVGLEERLSEKIEVCLYRITQELLNNVVKHSTANFVSVVISKQNNFVSLIFEDNGKGFDQDQIKKGIGMTSLSSRLDIVNGNLKFETSEGTGTMAIIKIPLV
jgi:signal transduction histidine kinase